MWNTLTDDERDIILEATAFGIQAEDGIRDLVRSRGLGDVYKRQPIRFGRILSIKNDEGSSFRELCEYIRVRIENIYLD